MRRKLRWLVPLALVAGMLSVPVASAEYNFTEGGARKVLKDAVYKRYGLNRSRVATFCRPQGEKKAEKGRTYHRWVCGWAYDHAECDSNELLVGQYLIAGQTGAGRYVYQVLNGARCVKE